VFLVADEAIAHAQNCDNQNLRGQVPSHTSVQDLSFEVAIDLIAIIWQKLFRASVDFDPVAQTGGCRSPRLALRLVRSGPTLRHFSQLLRLFLMAKLMEILVASN
jgi:hypothetical protein